MFLREIGLVLGVVAAVALVFVVVKSRDATELGIAMTAGGGVVAVLSGRVVLTAFGDPNVFYDLALAGFMVLGAVVAAVGVLVTLAARDRRSQQPSERSASPK